MHQIWFTVVPINHCGSFHGNVWVNASAVLVRLFQVTEDEFLRLQALYMARIEELELKVLFVSFVVVMVEVGSVIIFVT